MKASTPAANPARASQEDVPARLVATAIALYGAHGTHAVSTRAIQRKAGILNEAAVRYYFGGKAGLLDACLAEVAAQYAPVADLAWQELDQLQQGRPITVSDVIAALVSSIYSLYLANAGGVQLLARMIREEGGDGQDLLLKYFGELIWRLEDTLRDLLPGKSATALRLHAFLALNSTVNGVVDQSLLWRLPAVGSGQGQFHLSGSDLARGFVEYVAAGVSAISEL